MNLKNSIKSVNYSQINLGFSCLQTWTCFFYLKKGIRGGFTLAVKRYAKVNNKYMGEQHNDQ